MLKEAVLILGGNQGDTTKLLESAKKMINTEDRIIKESSIYLTEAWGDAADQDFLNQVIVVETDKDPLKFLVGLQKVEIELGRVRETVWGNRTMDIDILFWGSDVIELPDLKVPHLFMAVRRFVLVPLVEIMPDFVHPELNKTCRDLLEMCRDHSEVKLFKQ